MIRFTFLLLGVVVFTSPFEQPKVTTSLGVLEGLTLNSRNGNKFYGFQGVPYAKPPIGDHRFKQSVAGTKWTGALNATRIPNMCMQRPNKGLQAPYPVDVIGSEDCLYLNIYTPKLPADLSDGKFLDVIFYIHGGAFQILSGDVWGPEYIMDRNVVFVNFNYRMGVLGFLSLEDKTCPGNNGLKDQNLALKWVNKHIAAFGGDPNKITIVGFSAGSASVHYHLLSPLSEGLFKKAIANSGVAQNPWALTKKPKEKALVIAKAVGCPTNDPILILKCMRERPAEELVASLKLLEPWPNFPIDPMGPVIERPNIKMYHHRRTQFIDQQPNDLIKSKKFNDVPVLFSHTNDEGSLFATQAIATPEMIAETEKYWDTKAPTVYETTDTADPSNGKDLPELIRKHYLGSRKLLEAIPDFIRSISDRYFISGIQQAALLHAKYQASPVYMYRFSHAGQEYNTFNKMLEQVYPVAGAPHGFDHGHVFKSTFLPFPMENYTEAKAMSETMIDYYIKFITETPVSGWSAVNSKLPGLTFMDIVSPDPSTNVFKTEEPVGPKFWDTLKLHENSGASV